MSATHIINPAINDFCKLSSSSPPILHSKVPCSQHLRRIKRDLFGAADPRDINTIFNNEMDKHYEQTSKKWGFDFRNGVPLNMNTQFDWELVSNQENYLVPQMYTLTRAAHVPLPLEWPCGTNDLLMDERAGRENIIHVTSLSDLSDDMPEYNEDVSVLLKLPAISNIELQKQKKQQHQRYHQQKSIPPMSSTSICKMQLRKRQPKITEYMKERKRLAQVPKKVSPSKRVRLTSDNSASTETAVKISSSSLSYNTEMVNNHSISFHFSLRSSRHN